MSDIHGAATDGGQDVTGTDAGAEDNFDALFEAARVQDAAQDADQPPAEAGTQAAADTGAQADAATEQAGEQSDPKRQPLTVEEYERRHQNLNAALAEERRIRREAEGRNAQQLQELRQRLGLDEDPDADPLAGLDVDKDPIGAIETLLKVLAGQQQQTAEQRREDQKRQAAENARRDYQDRATAYEAEVTAQHPDYPEALQFVMDRLISERVELGYDKDAAEAEVDALAYNTTQDLMRRGVNPARYAYGLAVKNGYTAGAAKAAPAAGQAAAAAQPKPAADPAAAQAAAVKKIEAIAAGQAASSPLSSAGAGRAGDNMTWDAVGNLEGAAFDAAFAKLMEQERKNDRAA